MPCLLLVKYQEQTHFYRLEIYEFLYRNCCHSGPMQVPLGTFSMKNVSQCFLIFLRLMQVKALKDRFIVGRGRMVNCLSNFVAYSTSHDNVIKWKEFLRYWPFVQGIHWSPVNSTHKGQWRRALMFSLVGGWTNSWVNNRGAIDLRHHHAHHNVTVMSQPFCLFTMLTGCWLPSHSDPELITEILWKFSLL